MSGAGDAYRARCGGCEVRDALVEAATRSVDDANEKLKQGIAMIVAGRRREDEMRAALEKATAALKACSGNHDSVRSVRPWLSGLVVGVLVTAGLWAFVEGVARHM